MFHFYSEEILYISCVYKNNYIFKLFRESHLHTIQYFYIDLLIQIIAKKYTYNYLNSLIFYCVLINQ